MHAARRLPPRALSGIATPRPLVADWGHALSATHRPFQLVMLQGAVAGPLTNGTLLVPLLMSLGLSAGAVWLLMLVPSVGVVLQALLPAILRCSGGRLRGVTVAAYLGSATRGLWYAGLVALHAAGLLSTPATVAALSVVLVLAGLLDNVAGNGLGIWYGLVLPERERRRLLPRLGTLAAAATALVLWLMTALLDGRGDIPAAVEVVCFAIAGLVSLVGLAGLLRLPLPGRVGSATPRASAHAGSNTSTDPAAAAGWVAAGSFRNLCTSSTLAAVGGGLMPAVALIALGPLGLPPTFTVQLAAVGATLSLVGSAIAASVVGGLSAGHVMRATHVARLGEVAAVGTAVLVPPLAPALLLLATGMEALTSAANGIAGSELLYRVAGPAIATQRGRYTALTHGSYTIASLAASLLVTASAGIPVFLGLLAAAGTLRVAGAATLRVRTGWRDPAPDAPAPRAPRPTAGAQVTDDPPGTGPAMETGRPLAALS